MGALNGSFTKLTFKRWESTAHSKTKNRNLTVTLGSTETKSNTVAETMPENPTSCSTGPPLHTTWTKKLASQPESSSRTVTQRRDATKSSKKMLADNRSTPLRITLTKWINSIVSTNVTRLERKLRDHGALTISQFLMRL